ncbi:citrate synthase [Desulfotalea psychrophila]|uniref:Citrate synthase n=1 Tax=Desulfotalea psychrophila (strain LSv54 / DSM 12343) TaxID=177439 RepID=Q6ARA1_DESPS|nr:citrate synthase [Desulfotalea psychrophila]CAG35123.1 probable citrate synthase [Desulfotalea psychrophila LSv54]
MSEKATLTVGGASYELDVTSGTEDERCIDIQSLRAKSGYITMDPGFGSTGACFSDITYVDGERGILRYRGYPIEQIAERASFVETCSLIIYGELPDAETLNRFRRALAEHAPLHTSLYHYFSGFPESSPPMAILSAMLNLVSCFHPGVLEVHSEGHGFDRTAALLLSKVRTIAAWSYRMSVGKPFNQPNPHLTYCANFLHMMFSEPFQEYIPSPAVERALALFLILHADHEQNCSTSTVRTVASSRANLFSSVASGVCALWGPLHGGANAAVIEMLEEIMASGRKIDYYINRAKDKSNDYKLMGFGHRVYKNFDPRASILKKRVYEVLAELHKSDPLLDIALELEEKTLKDEYFISRKLYPNVDFYSGILLRAIGIPPEMYTVMFAIGRMPGWIANWRELHDQNLRITRPRQVYTGRQERSFVPLEER